ncbi:sigma-54 interaction domain-containing protein [Sphaerochaeta sp.]|uniref:sigma-54 interaction domain-containing protein n=1 Tax=Sphaerochaeta sp. TaxID=1972642 RepID=UPI003D12FD27
MKDTIYKALNYMSEYVIITDTDGKVLFTNLQQSDTLNVKYGQMLGAVYPEIWNCVSEHFVETGVDSFVSDKLEIENKHFEFRVRNERDKYILILKDITNSDALRAMAQSSCEKLELLNAIVTATSDGIWVSDGSGNVILVNPAAERINNIKSEQIAGRSMYDLIGEGFIDRSAVVEVLERKVPVSLLQYREGRKLSSTGTPVFNEDGSISTVVVSTQDITEIDNLRKELDKQELLTDNYRSQALELQNKYLLENDFVAKSENIIRAFSQAIKASCFDSTVLLMGESGSGKGMFAKLIHKHSKRADKPYISINCGAIPESLIESELFGYEKGAFTGAMISKPGLIEIADGGVLFLDEVGELPLQAQVKLLKFLEDGVVTRLGSTSPKKLHVKIIAATHRNIQKMVQEKKFREDLFYRLNVIPIIIPPLRERKACLPLMINYYLDKIASQYDVKKRLSRRALDCLTAYGYPGNVRQLINICERLVVMTETDIIDVEDLPGEVTCSGGSQTDIMPEDTLKSAYDKLEKTMLTQAVKKFANQNEIAKHMGISQASVVRKLRKHSLKTGMADN